MIPNEEQQCLDQKFQDGFAQLNPGETCPPCPACGSKMEPWDAWLVTGATCSNQQCGWNYSEGSGCLCPE